MAQEKSRILKSAEKYVASGKNNQAIEEYLKILKENPKEWNIMIQVGDLYLKVNKTAEAVDWFQRVADHYYTDGFFLKAIAIYKRINKIDPNLTDICLKLSDLYLKQGLTMDAKSQLHIVAQNYINKNENKEAIGTLKKLIEIEPDNLKTRNDLAKAYKTEGMIPEAIKEYLEISEELMRKNLLKESLAVLETANKLDPRDAEILRRIMQIYTQQHEGAKASALLDDALRVDPSNADILALVAESHADQNDFAKAHELIDRAILNSGRKDPFWRTKGDFYLKAGELPRAFSQYTQVIEKLVQRKDLEEAIHLLQKITKAEPSFYPAWLRLVDLYSIQRQPSNVITALEALVDAYITKGLYQEASRYVKKLIEIEPEDSQHQQKLEFINSNLQQTGAAESQQTEEQAEPADAVASEIDQTSPPEIALRTPVAKDRALVQEAAEIATTTTTPTEEEKEFVSEHLIEAEVFNKYGLIDKAIEQVQAVISRFPDSVQAHQKLKEIFLEKGERDKAVEECVAMSRILRKRGELDQAEDILSEGRQINPNHAALERAYKEMPAAAKSPDVMGEIEKLAESMKTTSGAIKIPGKPPARKDLSSTQSILSRLFPSGNARPEKSSPSLKIPKPGAPSELEQKPEAALDINVFEEIDFYSGQGMKDDARRLLLDLKEKHPDDPGILQRLQQLETGEAPAHAASQPQQELVANEDEIIVDLDDFELPNFETPVPATDEIAASSDEVDIDLDMDLDASVDADVDLNATTLVTEPLFSDQPPDLGDLAQVAKEAEERSIPASEELEVDIEDLADASDEPMEPMEVVPEVTSEPETGAVRPEFAELEDAAVATATPATEAQPHEEVPVSASAAQPDDARVYGDAMDAVFTQREANAEEEARPEVTVSVKAPEELFEEEDQFFDLAAELEEGFLNVQSAVEEEKPPDGQNYSLEQILSDFRKGVDKQVSPEDYDTRYNLGIAYKEMGLIDEAIAEFQFASKDPGRFLECCSMLGLCFMEKGMQKLAIKWYQRGLDSPGFSEDEYQGLRFDLAQAYETMGDPAKALEVYQEVYGVNAGYRNVSRKIKDLQDQLKK